MQVIDCLEQNAYSHFKYLPSKLNFPVMETAAGTIINCGLGSSMFNIICASKIDSTTDIDKQIQDTINVFGGQGFAWWLGPNSKPADLGARLHHAGFTTESTEYAMTCELIHNLSKCNYSKSQMPEDFLIKQVVNQEQLSDFTSILESYDYSANAFYLQLKNIEDCKKELIFVGYYKSKPVTIGMLHITRDMGGIYGLLTKPKFRGKGFATAIIQHLMQRANHLELTHVGLIASNESGRRIYEKLGFESIGVMECYEWQSTVN